jgi:hypothetical protein
MTVPATARRAGPFSGNGVTTTFSFSFKTFAAGDLLVTKMDSLGIETSLVLNSDYSVSLNVDQDASPGGTITYPISGSPLPSGQKLTIVGDLEYEQTTDLLGGGAFNARVIEDTFDRTVIQIQQLEERLDRALLVPVNSTANVQLPNPEPNELIGWDSTGSNLANYALSQLATGIAYGTTRFDTFTGNGSTTQFALTEDPAALANLDVSISGVTQVPGTDYTLTSATLVFTSAPANGAVILARYGRALPVTGPVDSSAVTHVAAGTNAVATTVQAKLRETVSVRDFGAVGDGVKDDTAAIQLAVDVMTDDSILYFPRGKYNIRARVFIQDLNNISVTGDGATVFATVQPSQLEFTNIGGLTIQGLTFDCNGYVTGACVVINSLDVRVFDCRFIHSGDGGGPPGFGYGFVHNTTSGSVGTKRSGLMVSDCVFANVTRDGLQTKSVDDVVITNCVFRDCGGAGTDHHAFGVGVATGARLQVSNCTFKNCNDGVFTGNERYSITGNTFENCVTAIYFDTADGVVSSNNVKSCQYGVRTITATIDPTSGLLVADNILDTSVKHIELFGSTGPVYATIKNNVFGSGSNQVHVRRDGGIVRLQNNTWVGNVIFFTDDGPTPCTKEIDESVYVTLADAATSSNLTQFLSQANFGGMWVTIEDVTGFDSAYQGKCGYSDVAPVGTLYTLGYNGANIIFRNFQPTTLSATNVQIGPNASGQFRVRNDSGATKTFKITFES